MSKKRIIIIIVGVLILLIGGYQITNNIYEKGRKEGYTTGYTAGDKKGNQEGYDKGYKIGYHTGKLTGEEDFRLTFSAALKGASAVLADAKLEELNPQLLLHKISQEKKEPLIRNTITNFTSSLNSIILDQLINFGEFSTQQRDTLFSKYKRIENKLSEQAYQEYLDNLKKLNKNAEILDKAKALSEGSGSVLCNLIDLFSPANKAIISQKMLEVGNKRNREENLAESLITYISNPS